MPRVLLGLGANLGEPAAQIETGLSRIDGLPETRLLRRSSLYRSDPVGPAGQPDYCNAVCSIETSLAPLELLDALQAIEAQAGRERNAVRWDARMLDLDILHFEDRVLETSRLTLPHPQIAYRSWVLLPLAEIEPALEIPPLGSVAHLLARLAEKGENLTLERWS